MVPPIFGRTRSERCAYRNGDAFRAHDEALARKDQGGAPDLTAWLRLRRPRLAPAQVDILDVLARRVDRGGNVQFGSDVSPVSMPYPSVPAPARPRPPPWSGCPVATATSTPSPSPGPHPPYPSVVSAHVWSRTNSGGVNSSQSNPSPCLQPPAARPGISIVNQSMFDPNAILRSRAPLRPVPDVTLQPARWGNSCRSRRARRETLSDEKGPCVQAIRRRVARWTAGVRHEALPRIPVGPFCGRRSD